MTQAGILLGAGLAPLVFGAVLTHSSYAVAWTLSGAAASALLMLAIDAVGARERGRRVPTAC